MAAEAERTLELDRIIVFSDGVFAIAITLLVLGLRVPALPSHVSNSELSRHLLDEWPRVLSYAVSFAVIGLYWIGHHRVFGHISRFDHRLILLNLAFLGLIAFLPFPTAVLGRYGGHFLVLRRIVDIRNGDVGAEEGAFA